MKKKINERNVIKVKCVDFSFDGQGICKNNGRTIFVPSLLKDEEAEVEILYRKKDFDIGRIIKILKFSEFRILPKCKISTACGGCSFQNLDYKKELEYKRDVAINTLKRVGGITNINPEITGMEDPYYYRNKIQVPFGYDKYKHIEYGLYRFKSHDIVKVDECPVSSIEHVKILKDVRNLMESMKISAYDEDLEKGIIRHCLIRVAKVTHEVMVVFVLNEKGFKSQNNFVKELVKLNPNITTIIFNYNLRKTNVILGEKEEVKYGKGYIIDELLNTKFKISSKSFYQINHDQCEKLYSLALTKAKLNKDMKILDCYCGIGTIGLIASRYVKEVDGIEIVEEAIKDAKENMKLNDIQNCNFYVKDAKDVLFNHSYDCVFLDPPRKGLDSKFIKRLINSHPKNIVYISCDVGTFSRDLKILKEYYDIESIDFVDMFPRTFHIESVGILRKKK